MTQRRSLTSAMELTPEKLAFIQGRGATSPAARGEPKQEPSAVIEEPAAQPAVEDLADTVPGDVSSTSRSRRAPRHRTPRDESTAYAMLEHLRVPVSARLSPRIAEALRRAHWEQKLRRLDPATQQEIIETALHGWLEENGFLDK